MPPNTHPAFKSSFLHPTYWGLWLLFGIMRCAVWLPYPLLMKLGQGIGWFGYQLLKWRKHHRVHVVHTNLKLCFPQLSDTAHQELEIRTWQSLGMGIMETALAWWAADKTIDKLVTEVQGFEHVEKALQQDQGIQILFAHYCTLELGGRWIGDRIPLCATSKRYHNPLSHYMIVKHRLQHLKAVLMPEDFKQTVKRLKQKDTIAFMLDLDFGPKNTVMDTFMGVNCATTTTNAKLAKQLNTAVIPMRCYRLPNNKGYGVAFTAPLKNYGDLNDVSAARLFNELIETQVKQYPEQYYWLHQRFKTQANGRSPYQ